MVAHGPEVVDEAPDLLAAGRLVRRPEDRRGVERGRHQRAQVRLEELAPVLREAIDRYNRRTGGELKVAPVVNDYFGGDVSVAGLLTGGDFLAARGQVHGDFVIIPRVSLKSDEPVFLDGVRFEELERQFAVPVHAFDFDQLASFLQTKSGACRQ